VKNDHWEQKGMSTWYLQLSLVENGVTPIPNIIIFFIQWPFDDGIPQIQTQSGHWTHSAPSSKRCTAAGTAAFGAATAFGAGVTAAGVEASQKTPTFCGNLAISKSFTLNMDEQGYFSVLSRDAGRYQQGCNEVWNSFGVKFKV